MNLHGGSCAIMFLESVAADWACEHLSDSHRYDGRFAREGIIRYTALFALSMRGNPSCVGGVSTAKQRITSSTPTARYPSADGKVRVTCISTTPRLREFALVWSEGVANAAVSLSASTFYRTTDRCTDGECPSEFSDPSAGDLERGQVETGQPCYRSLMGP